jgi:cysteinyl-tRNA synthetase
VRLYNTLTKSKEPLEAEDTLGIYVCGITPYDYSHVGHARVYVLWDVFRRYFSWRGFKVKYVQNFTDIDDKIIAKAKEEKTDPEEIAQRYIDDFFKMMEQLGVRKAAVYPRVTEHIEDVIELVKKLVERGHAYTVGPEDHADVYFDLESFPDYGKLSGRNLDEMEAGSRVEVDSRKKNPMDFAVWKAAKEGEPAWDSPWGPGRPGWHIECSAMSLKYLGNNFTIHGGGSDLVFPHHENEIAQSVCATGQPFAKFWVHNGFVQVRGEKMSKSLGNFFTIGDVLKEYSPRALRYFLISTHYRKPLGYGEDELIMSQRALERLTLAREQLELTLGEEPRGETTLPLASLVEELNQLKDGFVAAMDDDLNTAGALASLHELATITNRALEQLGEPSQEELDFLGELEATFQALGDEVLGLWDPPEEKQESNLGPLLDLILELRTRARSERDWATADLIRDRLAELGYKIEDTPQGPRWRRSL